MGWRGAQRAGAREMQGWGRAGMSGPRNGLAIVRASEGKEGLVRARQCV